MNNTFWLIVDVSRYSFEIKPLILEILNRNNLDNKLTNQILEYCLITSISETLSLPVVYKRDSYLENMFYSKIKQNCDMVVFNLFDKRYLNMFMNQEVKLLFTGNNLFITTFKEI
jgi:hypothetical protein